MREDKKNVRLEWSPKHPKTDEKSWQLGMAVWGKAKNERTAWVSVVKATAAARLHGGYVILGYFDPRSATVKRNLQ